MTAWRRCCRTHSCCRPMRISRYQQQIAWKRRLITALAPSPSQKKRNKKTRQPPVVIDLLGAALILLVDSALSISLPERTWWSFRSGRGLWSFHHQVDTNRPLLGPGSSTRGMPPSWLRPGTCLDHESREAEIYFTLGRFTIFHWVLFSFTTFQSIGRRGPGGVSHQRRAEFADGRRRCAFFGSSHSESWLRPEAETTDGKGTIWVAAHHPKARDENRDDVIDSFYTKWKPLYVFS